MQEILKHQILYTFRIYRKIREGFLQFFLVRDNLYRILSDLNKLLDVG